MTLRRIDYEWVKRVILSHLYHYRNEVNADERSSTKIASVVKHERKSVENALFELKGMGLIDKFFVGRALIWRLTDDGIKYLKKDKEENKEKYNIINNKDC